MREGNIVVIGGGIAGSATAWALARAGAGARVTLLEREDACGSHSSGRNAAILRTAIENETTRALALETTDFLLSPPARFAEVPLLDPTGLVVCAGEPGEPPPVWAEPLVRAGEAEPLDARGLDHRAPFFRPKGTNAYWLPRCGRIDIAALLDAFLRGARHGGVLARTRSAVSEIVRVEGRVVGVRLEGGELIDAETVVVAGGAWAGELGAGVGSRVRPRVTRRHLLVTGVDERVDPRWPVVWDDVAGLYARPESGGMLVSACDIADATAGVPAPDPDVRVLVAEKVARHLPGLVDATAAHFWAGQRTLTVDDAPIAGDDPDVAGLFWVAGLGGHGMSVSAGLGRVAAEVLLGHGDPAPGLRPGRAALGGAARERVHGDA